ncbi:MAG: OadG family transporter subunit, partial [Ruthenibacterium sp.]
MEYANWFVCVMGMGITFIGLSILILLINLVSRFCPKPKAVQPLSPAVQPENRQELLAAVSAAIAAELHT